MKLKVKFKSNLIILQTQFKLHLYETLNAKLFFETLFWLHDITPFLIKIVTLIRA